MPRCRARSAPHRRHWRTTAHSGPAPVRLRPSGTSTIDVVSAPAQSFDADAGRFVPTQRSRAVAAETARGRARSECPTSARASDSRTCDCRLIAMAISRYEWGTTPRPASGTDRRDLSGGGIGRLRRGPEPATVAFDFESRSRKPPPAFGGRGHSLNDVRGAHLLVDEYQDLSRAEQGLIGLCSGATSLAIHLLGAAGRDESAPAVAGPGQRQPATASGHSCRARDLERDQHLDQPRRAEARLHGRSPRLGPVHPGELPPATLTTMETCCPGWPVSDSPASSCRDFRVTEVVPGRRRYPGTNR